MAHAPRAVWRSYFATINVAIIRRQCRPLATGIDFREGNSGSVVTQEFHLQGDRHAERFVVLVVHDRANGFRFNIRRILSNQMFENP